MGAVRVAHPPPPRLGAGRPAWAGGDGAGAANGVELATAADEDGEEWQE